MQKPGRQARPREQGSRWIKIKTEKIKKTLWDPRRESWDRNDAGYLFWFLSLNAPESEVQRMGTGFPLKVPCCYASLQALGPVPGYHSHLTNSSNMLRMLLPQGLCTCCFCSPYICLAHSPTFSVSTLGPLWGSISGQSLFPFYFH